MKVVRDKICFHAISSVRSNKNSTIHQTQLLDHKDIFKKSLLKKVFMVVGLEELGCTQVGQRVRFSSCAHYFWSRSKEQLIKSNNFTKKAKYYSDFTAPRCKTASSFSKTQKSSDTTSSKEVFCGQMIQSVTSRGTKNSTLGYHIKI